MYKWVCIGKSILKGRKKFSRGKENCCSHQQHAMREQNRISKQIAYKNPDWKDEKDIKTAKAGQQSKEENVNATGVVFENPISLGTVLTQLRSHF